jgi:hypothetical protein
MRSFLLSLLALAIGGAPIHPAAASSPAPICTTAATPPPELAGWTHRTPQAAGAVVDSAPLLAPGAAADLTLMPVGGVHFVVPLGRMSAPADKGGLLTFRAPAAGTYRVALGAGGWIDMVRGTTSIPSSAHGHGPDCTGIRKMVDFPLEAGLYTVQVSASAMDVMPVLIVRLP